MKRFFCVFLAISQLFLTGCAFSFSTAKVKDVKLCTEPDANGACIDHTDTVNWDKSVIRATVNLSAAPNGTLIRSEWWYTTGNHKIDEASVMIEDDDSTAYFAIAKPKRSFPSGNYELRIFLNVDAEPHVTKFTVPEGSPNSSKQ